MMGRCWIESEGLGLFRARRKNSRKWLEGYYVRVLETAGHGSPAFCHYIIFQKANGLGRMCRAEVDHGTLCRCTGIRDKKRRLIFEHDIVRRKIWDKDLSKEVVWSDIGLTVFLEVMGKNKKVCPTATLSVGAGLTMMREISILTKLQAMSLTAQSAEVPELNRAGGLITAQVYGII